MSVRVSVCVRSEWRRVPFLHGTARLHLNVIHRRLFGSDRFRTAPWNKNQRSWTPLNEEEVFSGMTSYQSRLKSPKSENGYYSRLRSMGVGHKLDAQ